MIKEKANIAVFISGRGTNLKALVLRSNKKTCNYKIAYVISNKRNAAGLTIARKNKILTKVISQSFLKIEQKKLAKILIDKNSVHGSDSVENANKEINFFFKT